MAPPSLATITTRLFVPRANKPRPRAAMSPGTPACTVVARKPCDGTCSAFPLSCTERICPSAAMVRSKEAQLGSAMVKLTLNNRRVGPPCELLSPIPAISPFGREQFQLGARRSVATACGKEGAL